MLTITDGVSLARALRMPLDPGIKRLLRLRCKQLGGDTTGQVRFVIFQPGDTLDQLDRQLSFSVFQNAGDGSRIGELDFTPGWEWIEDHGHFFELVFIFDDSGFAHVVLIENSQGVDPELLSLCRVYAGD